MTRQCRKREERERRKRLRRAEKRDIDADLPMRFGTLEQMAEAEREEPNAT